MSPACTPRHALPLLLLVLAPAHAVAQLDFVNKVFSKVTDIDAAYVVGTPIWNNGLLTDSSSGALGRLQGISIEALFNIGTLAKRKACTLHVEADSTLAQIEVHRAGHGSVDSVFKYNVTTERWGCESVEAELGLGYSQLSGFRGDAFGLQGSIEELPAISLYLSVYPFPKANVSLYGGVRTGLTALKDFRATVGDTLEKGTGSTVEYGLIGGISVGGNDGRWALFAEAAFTKRTFRGVTWDGKANAIPVALQEPLRPSTRTLAFGGQISLPQQ